MGAIVYAVPGITPKGSEIPDLKKARALAHEHGVHVFAYRQNADGSLTMLGSQSPKGRVVKYEENPLKEFRGPALASTLRQMGQTGYTVSRDLKTGAETKSPKSVYFQEPEAALQALAVFLVLEGVDTRGAADISGGPTHKKQAAIRLPNGDVYSATLSPEQNDYWIFFGAHKRPLRWGTWAREGQYPATSAGQKKNPRSNPAEFTVFHADHGIAPEQMEYIKGRLEQEAPQGFFLREISLPRELGAVRNAMYGPAAGDAPVPESDVSYRPRGDRPWSDRVVSWPARPVDYVQAIGTREGDAFKLFTVYGGPLAPQNPDDPGCRDVEGARKFWSQHALSLEQWKSNPRRNPSEAADLHSQIQGSMQWAAGKLKLMNTSSRGSIMNESQDLIYELKSALRAAESLLKYAQEHMR